jgi:hypothetical protein
MIMNELNFNMSAKTDEYDPGFVEMPMWDQLAKVLDSRGNPKPRDWVKTDDGDIISGITPDRAAKILDTLADIKPLVRLELIKKLQTTKGFKKIESAIQ